MHNCKKNGSKNKQESMTGKHKMMHLKQRTMLTKLQLLLKWDKSLRTNPPLERNKWWRRCKNTTRCLLVRRNREKLTGVMTNSPRMLLRSIEPIWVILCKKISQQLNLNLLHTDLYHITSRALEKNKSKILLLKETNKSLMLSLHKRINAQKNTLGPSKICQIPSINSITKLN